MSTPRALASLRARRWASARPLDGPAQDLDQDERRDAQHEPAGGRGDRGRDRDGPPDLDLLAGLLVCGDGQMAHFGHQLTVEGLFFGLVVGRLGQEKRV